MIRGVTEGFEKRLEIVGIGYRVQLAGRNLTFSLGYSHPIVFPLPDGVQADVDKQTTIVLRGVDKHLVGQTAAQIRALRRPDPYKGKGIRYADEVVRRKVGKAGAK
jgi:large subunit ribosomal protein L6